MTVETTDRKVTHEMSELLTEYAFTFRALLSTPSDIKAILRNTVTNTSEDMVYVEDLPEDPDPVTDRLKYTVVVNEDGVGGIIEVAVAADDDNEVTIYRQTTDLQSSAYDDYNQFPAKTVESDFDRRTMVTQEILEEIGRTLKVPITAESGEVPDPEADTYLGWDANLELVNKSLPDPTILETADQADAEAGTNNTKMMTPLRSRQGFTQALSDAVGTTAGKLVQLDGDAKLPAVDGSQLINLPAAEGVPSGVICMWSGTIATIPSGWNLCDGSNSTPDLRDRFVVGARQDETGVAKTNVTGSLTQGGDGTIPSHTHTGPSHTHTIPNVVAGSGTGTAAFSSGQSTTQQSGASGTGATGASGTGTKNIAVYWALAFIQKA